MKVKSVSAKAKQLINFNILLKPKSVDFFVINYDKIELSPYYNLAKAIEYFVPLLRISHNITIKVTGIDYLGKDSSQINYKVTIYKYNLSKRINIKKIFIFQQSHNKIHQILYHCSDKTQFNYYFFDELIDGIGFRTIWYHGAGYGDGCSKRVLIPCHELGFYVAEHDPNSDKYLTCDKCAYYFGQLNLKCAITPLSEGICSDYVEK